ncbi:putative uncharacterized transposon-derived protein F54H12.3 [Dictyocoela muelleri]|nr:putative uncharacterized transposon-derived protein F54H12.3 [Dictyocoela muelleri]
MNYKKRIKKDLERNGLFASTGRIRRVLSNCIVCQKKDKKSSHLGKHILTSYPGERVPFDILEIKKDNFILLGIDYFTRKVFGKSINSKNSQKIAEFIKYVHGELPIKTLLTDNGREFNNEILKKMCSENGIFQVFAIPYYHKSNGRIERANRTIRDALRHEKRSAKFVLKGVMANYNNSIHRGIGMSPNEALNSENWDRVLDKQEVYKNEFKCNKYSLKSFKPNEKVIIKNELKLNKMDNEFRETGIIKNVLGQNSYEVITDANKTIVRHSTQLKGFKEGNVGCNASYENIYLMSNEKGVKSPYSLDSK